MTIPGASGKVVYTKNGYPCGTGTKSKIQDVPDGSGTVGNYACAKFKAWMTIVESGWNVWVWLVGVVSRRWVWLVGVGGIYGCGCKEVYRFPHTTYPYYSCICSFLQQHPYFFLFFVLYICIGIDLLCNFSCHA